MDSKWDILQALHRLMNQIQERPILEWVASYQDDDTSDIATLPTGTQLNITADKLATNGLRRLHTKPRVLIDPSTEVLLHHKG